MAVAMANMGANVLLCLGAAWLGMGLARLL